MGRLYWLGPKYGEALLVGASGVGLGPKYGEALLVGASGVDESFRRARRLRRRACLSRRGRRWTPVPEATLGGAFSATGKVPVRDCRQHRNHGQRNQDDGEDAAGERPADDSHDRKKNDANEQPHTLTKLPVGVEE
jgi:hypothetical protein